MILYGISYSPWSLRAKWAFTHHDVEFEYREYLSMVMTPLLRWKLRDVRSPITVPILFDGDVVLRDSLDIARYVDQRGRGETLFADDDEMVETWTTTADEIADAGRVITTFRVLADSEATMENVPHQIPKPLHRAARPIVDAGGRYLAAKYGFTTADIDPARRQIRRALERIANRLVVSDHLGAGFGWPDIAVAAALQFVQPAETWVRLGNASRRCWTRPELAEQFSDVLAWRDELLARHRP